MSADRTSPATEAFDAVRVAVSTLQLDRWQVIEPQLLIRARVDAARTWQDRDGPRLEVVLPVPEQSPSRIDDANHWSGVIPLHRLPWRSWAVSSEQIWRAATRNTRKLLRPTVTNAAVGPFEVWLLTGDISTPGVALDIGYFIRTSDAYDTTVFAVRTGWWSVLSDNAAVLLTVAGDTHGHADEANLTDINRWQKAWSLIAELRRQTDRPFPPNLFRYHQVGAASPCRFP